MALFLIPLLVVFKVFKFVICELPIYCAILFAILWYLQYSKMRKLDNTTLEYGKHKRNATVFLVFFIIFACIALGANLWAHSMNMFPSWA